MEIFIKRISNRNWLSRKERKTPVTSGDLPGPRAREQTTPDKHFISLIRGEYRISMV